MGSLQKQYPVKVIFSVIFRLPEQLRKAERAIAKLTGEFDDLILECPFNTTDYYREEFGEGLSRKFLSAKKNISLEGLHKIKTRTNCIEDRLRVNGSRTVNIDPGYVTEAKLILFSTKDHAHRIYLGDAIFAEQTLYYHDKSYRPRSWTYPDYASLVLIEHFNRVREIYRSGISREKRK
ncbi:MAG: DUF4416 family protein [Candidatus Omnitrophica bacterium]|nr:DUF4416 family protein [Candidatus Omnitrophota bacterium]